MVNAHDDFSITQPLMRSHVLYGLILKTPADSAAQGEGALLRLGHGPHQAELLGSEDPGGAPLSLQSSVSSSVRAQAMPGVALGTFQS